MSNIQQQATIKKASNTASTPAAPGAPAAQQGGAGSQKAKVSLASAKSMEQAQKLSIKLVKPICFYFYVDSLKGKVVIKSDGEDRIVFKNEDEHTSPILNTFKCETEYIIVTENTIYIISADTKIV
jgi:hypothetical protein